ncbi:sensor domain-containing protein [Mycobacterium arosiense]|uniref:Sensor domain-containing protein n=1 Tax=Mycobacterium arosiense ATCC BAA-1401 = DSM 45069 TaxID=1265311 RepID=A0A1W9ZRF6_MYCAI|nr:sensor domain-containing protein [Mycobacterium arosiense]ORA20369.1 sensor domain-containing protein [Mycobacterium arosiense ATCC BAA-1401 = DSM 45069]
MTGTTTPRCVGALLVIVVLASGCSVAVDGTARPVPGAAPRSLSGPTIKRVLLGKSALSRIVRQPLTIDPGFPPTIAGPESLQGDRAASPDDCIGVAVMLQQSAYRHQKVRDVAQETWRPESLAAAVIRVQEAVVDVPTPADAQALFVTFARQWQRCQGKTVALTGGPFRLKAKVDGVQVAASVLAATTSIELDSPNPLLEDSLPAGRAIGVRDNCLVEVEVDFASTPTPALRRPDEVDASALDIAQVMRDKVGALR